MYNSPNSCIYSCINVNSPNSAIGCWTKQKNGSCWEKSHSDLRACDLRECSQY